MMMMMVMIMIIIVILFRFILVALNLFSDNGPHYHNSAVLMYLAEVNTVFALKLVEYNNFEAGEGKTVLDTHFAHVSHKLVRWVRVGNDLESGEQLADLLEVNNMHYSRGLVCDFLGLQYTFQTYLVL